MTPEFETVIGLEVHAELSTVSKIFCSCATDFGAEPNTQVCPVCMGMPGGMPVLNRTAVETAVRAGLALGCEVQTYSAFDRKNYFYPDLPKGYQITQQERPLCLGGSLMIETAGGEKRIGIARIHIEEDAAKLVYSGGKVLVDFNRCGVPLAEIVTEPDIRGAEEAAAFLKKLRSVLRASGAAECRMSEGGMRCDVNISVRRRGEQFGERVELKNLSSFRSVARAIEYEAKRLIAAAERGEAAARETRRFDESTGRTFAMRRKESGGDYRYFPEPNLPPLILTEEEIERIRSSLPELPDARKRRYVSELGLAPFDAEQIASENAVADWFESAAALTPHRRRLAALTLTELFRLLPSDPESIPLTPERAARITDMAEAGEISAAVAKRLVERCFSEDVSPDAVVRAEGLGVIRDEGELEKILREALREEPKLLADYRRGKSAARGAMLGRVMRRTGGRADPQAASAALDRILNEE